MDKKISVLRLSLLLALAWAGAGFTVTISTFTNTNDPFDNKKPDSTSISVTLSASSDAYLNIYNLNGDTLLNPLYSDAGASSIAKTWSGIRLPVPAFKAPDTLPYGTYRIRAMVNLQLSYNAKAVGTGLIMDTVYDVASDASGNLYFCNQNSGIVYQIDTAGTLLARIVLSDPPLSLAGTQIWGIAVDDSNNIFLSDGANDRITKLIASTSYTTCVAKWNVGNSVGNSPRGLGSYGNNIWLADMAANRIREYDATGALIRDVALSSPQDVAVDPSGTYYYVVETNTTDEVRKFTCAANTASGNWTAIAASGIPLSIDVNASYVFVSASASDQVYRYNPDGTGGTQIGSGSGTNDGYVNGPAGVAAIKGDTRVAVIDQLNKRIELFSQTTGTWSATFNNDPSSLLMPRDVDVDPLGYVFVPVGALGKVNKYDQNGVYVCSFGSRGSDSGQLSDPRGIAVDDSGHVYVSDYSNNRVQRFTRVNNTTYTYAWQYPVNGPSSMCYGGDNNIYVAQRVGSDDIFIIKTDGTLRLHITSTAINVTYDMDGRVAISDLTDVAVDNQRNIWLCDYITGDIYKGTIQDTSYALSSYFWTRPRRDNEKWQGIAMDLYGNSYLSRAGATVPNRVRVMAPDGTYLVDVGATGSGNGQFNSPYGIAFARDHSAIWVADQNNDRLQKLVLTYDDKRDELVTLGDTLGNPSVTGVSFRRRSNDSTLISPIGSVFNNGYDSAVVVSVTFNEKMDSSYSPIVKIVDINNNQYAVTARTGAASYVNGWKKGATNIWEGYKDIPTGNDGLARVYVQNARDLTGDTLSPNPNDSFSLILDTYTPTPTITIPSDQSSTIESTLPIAGTAEPFSMIVVTNYDSLVGGSVISQQAGIQTDEGGDWSTDNIPVQINADFGANYLTAVATDLALNQSAGSTPRIKVSRMNILPGSITISPVSEVMSEDSAQWTLVYTAASALNDNCFLKIRIPTGWTDPQTASAVQAGYVSVTPGAGTTLDATPFDIVNTDTIRVNINSMSNAKTFTVTYGGPTAPGYAKVTSDAGCGITTFFTSLNDTVSVSSPTIYVRGKPVAVSSADRMPANTFYGQSNLNVMDLTFDNTTGGKPKLIKKVTFRTERSGAVAVGASSRLTLVTLKNAGQTYGSAVPTASSEVPITLSTPIPVGEGGTTTVGVYVNIKNTSSIVDSTLRLVVADSTWIRAVESASQESVMVRSSGDTFPKVSAYTTFKAASHPDSLKVKIEAITIPSLGEREREVVGLRMIFRNPTPAGANDVAIKGLSFTLNPATPSALVAKKMLRRKGLTTNLYSSSTIEGAGKMEFDLTLTPITIVQGAAPDTIDMMVDVVAGLTGSVQFSLAAETDIVSKDAILGSNVTVYGDGVAFPLASNSPAITNSTNTPSGKVIDGAIAVDWTAANERMDTYNTTEGFNVTWDNTNLYLTWNARDFSANGVVFFYLDTGAGGVNTTWNYGGLGTHVLPAGFGGADYVFYYDNASTKGLVDARAGYVAATFNGEVVATAAATEIRIPRTNLGNPSAVKIIPLVQNDGAATIAATVPYDGVGEFVRNPIGATPQTFKSWYTLASFAMTVNPKSHITIDSSSVTKKPLWTYDATGSAPITGLTVGYYGVYVSIGGAAPAVAYVDSDGVEQWRCPTAAGRIPTPVLTFWNGTSDIVIFGAGTYLYVIEDQVTGWANVGAGSYNLAVNVGRPIFSGSAADSNVYFLTSDGNLRKHLYSTGATAGGSFPVAASGNYLAGMTATATEIYVPCTDNTVKVYTLAGAPTGGVSVNVGASVNEDLFIDDRTGRLLIAPNSTFLWSRQTTSLTARWSLNLNATLKTGPFTDISSLTDTSSVYIGAGVYMKRLMDNGVGSVSTSWSYTATDQITSNPVPYNGTVYFGCDDKRLFAVQTANGSAQAGWPSTPLAAKTDARVAVDGFRNLIYFGTQGGKVYQYLAE